MSGDDDDLRIGVAGLGLRGDLPTHAHHPGAGAAVVACADPRPSADERARQWYGARVRIHRNHRQLLHEDLDAVFLCTPDDTHETLALDFLEAGVAVFVEKPLAISVQGCDRILAAARTHGTRLYVGHNMRHMPVIRTMREIIQRGDIGEVKAVWCRHFVGEGGDFYFKDWHAERARTTSLLLQKGAHDLDVIHWLAGGYSRQVTAMGGLTVYGDLPRAEPGTQRDSYMPDWRGTVWPPTAQTGLHPTIDVEDLSMLLARLDNGVHISYQQCHYTPDYWRNYTVIGSEGRLENFGDHGDTAEVRVWNRRRSGYRADADQVHTVASEDTGHGGSDPELVAEFLRFVREGGRTDTSPVAAREAVAAGCAATTSLREESRPVRVDPPPEELVDYFADSQPGAAVRG